MSPRPRISVFVPTLDGGTQFLRLCRHLVQVRDRFGLEVLVIDSGSADGTFEAAQRAGFRTTQIAREEFGHGRTRNLAAQAAEGEFLCFLTQDVLPCTPDWPIRFAAALADPAIAGAYGRQVPRDATTMEMFFVAVNYPAETLRFDPVPGGHHPRPGRVLFSNAFSAVRRELALRIPFREDVQVSEDQVWAHQVLDAGYSVVYTPDVEALHAHRYPLRGLYRRTYRVGVSLRTIGLDRGASLPESMRFLADEVGYFVRQGHVHRLPQLLAYEFTRWAGFQVGRRLASRAANNPGFHRERSRYHLASQRSRPR